MKIELIKKPGGDCPPCDRALKELTQLAIEKNFKLIVIEEEYDFYPAYRVNSIWCSRKELNKVLKI